MEKAFGKEKKSAGDVAVDGLIAGLPAGVGMAIVLALTGLLSDRQLLATLGYFDPSQDGNWLTGLLAHLAVAAIYGMVFALLMGALAGTQPSWRRLVVWWGVLYGMLLLTVVYGVWLAVVESPLAQIDTWQMATAHLVYGLLLGLWLNKNQ